MKIEKVGKNVDSIRKIHLRLVKEGYQISEYALRQWIKSGLLPATYVGTKALISFSAVLRLIEGDNPTSTAAPTV